MPADVVNTKTGTFFDIGGGILSAGHRRAERRAQRNVQVRLCEISAFSDSCSTCQTKEPELTAVRNTIFTLSPWNGTGLDSTITPISPRQQDYKENNNTFLCTVPR